jgi:hypothetical protein
MIELLEACKGGSHRPWGGGVAMNGQVSCEGPKGKTSLKVEGSQGSGRVTRRGSKRVTWTRRVSRSTCRMCKSTCSLGLVCISERLLLTNGVVGFVYQHAVLLVWFTPHGYSLEFVRYSL